MSGLGSAPSIVGRLQSEGENSVPPVPRRNDVIYFAFERQDSDEFTRQKE